MESLKQSAAAGARWTGLSALISAGLQAVQLLVLARLLGPEEFGLMAMAMVVVAFMQTIVDLGISSALVWRQDASDEQLCSLYVFGIGLGAAGFIIALLATPLGVWFFHEQALAKILPWCATTFLIGPAGQQFAALLQKNLRFREIAIMEIASQAVGLVVAVLLAWRGAGVMALVWSLLASAAARTVLLVKMGLPLWRPRWHFRPADLRGFIRFGAYQTGSGILNFALMRMDQILLGRLLGKVALGQYNFAYNLIMQPLTRINPILTRVAFPVFARLQDDEEKLRKGFLFMCRLLLTINVPLALGIAVIMPDTIGVIFQSRWAASVPIVQALAIVAILRSAGNPVGSLLLAKGRADTEFRWNIFVIVCQLAALWTGASLGGAVGAALGLVACQIIFQPVMYGWLIRPLIRPGAWHYFKTLALPVAPALAMVAILICLPHRIAGLNGAGKLTLEIAAGVLIYAGLLLTFQRRFVAEAVEIIRRH